MPHLLIVEDDLTFSTMLATWLGKHGFSVTTATSVGAALRHLAAGNRQPDIILSDFRLPDHDGLELLHRLRHEGRNVPFVMMTSYADVAHAVEAMKAGAADYVAKPVQPDILLGKLHDALANASPETGTKTEAPAEKAKRAVAHQGGAPMKAADAAPAASSPGKKVAAGNGGSAFLNGIEGTSAAARELYKLVSLVAPTPMSVLILGASGTGKEYVARRIHAESRRADGPFVAMDCGALTKELAASELFGHVRGAFTGATSDKAGAFEQAAGGTLFLDEVGNLGYDVQVQLLRALQERRVRPVGSTGEVAVDIRLVCATNEDLPAAIAAGTWREDLFHRLNEFTLRMPLLRERGEDIILFARYFLSRANAELSTDVADFTPEALALLRAYPWPGNLREMRNVVVRATLLSQTAGLITPAALGLDLPPVTPVASATPGVGPSPTMTNAVRPMRPTPDEERDRILAALRQADGNKSRAARLLGCDRKTLYNRMHALGL